MNNYSKLSVEETLKRAGYDSVEEVMKENLYGSSTGVPACCECGSYVESDGECPHGNPSILRERGVI